MCEWILANADSQLFNPEGTTLQSVLSEDILGLLSVETTPSENLDLPGVEEVERVTRTVVLLADAHQLSRGKGYGGLILLKYIHCYYY